jgi:hypothetical protein
MRRTLQAAASISLLIIAGSVAYFLLVYVPNRDRAESRMRAQREAQALQLQLEDRCAAQAKQATQTFIADRRSLGGRDEMFEDANHFNVDLKKCFVEISSTRINSKGGVNTWIYLVNAYEGTTVLQCFSAVIPNQPDNEYCVDNNGNHVDFSDGEKRLKGYMSQ